MALPGLGSRRVVIVGEGVLECEAAATARALGLDVTLIGILPSLMESQLGATVGGFLNGLRTEHGGS